jgi:hypothetical protein
MENPVMTENDPQRWSTEVERTPKKGVPRWLVGCGIGCGLMLVLGLIAGVFLWRGLTRMQDQDLQWERVAEVLPVTSPPEGFQVFGMPGFMPGFRDMWVFGTSDQSRSVVLLTLDSDPPPRDWGVLFDPEAGLDEQPEGMDVQGFLDAELGTLSVQGRGLRVLRYRTDPLEEEGTASEPEPEAEPRLLERLREGVEAATRYAGARVDLTPLAGDPLILLEYHRTDSLERIEDAELVEFLSSFDLSGR